MVHEGVACSKCHTTPIHGIRYQCSVQPNTSYCEDCEAKVSNYVKYPLVKVRDPKKAPKVNVEVKEQKFPAQAQPQSRESANLGILKSKCENKNASKIYTYKCGEVFNIGWTWINNGRKPWPEDTQLMQIAGHEIEMLKPCKLNKVINPDRKFTMYVDFKAPSKPGKYHAFFKLSHNPYTYG